MRLRMKISILVIFVLGLPFFAAAQKERKFVREGNGYFEQGLKDTAKLDTVSFGKAEVAYRRALEIRPNDFHWQFNLADAIYKQKKSDEAAKEFERLADETIKPGEKASVYHNLGNSFLTQKKFDPSIESYKKALRINPNDPETKYNLAYAMKMKKEEEKRKQQNQNKPDKNKKNNKDKNNQDKNRDQNQNNQNQDQKQQNQQNQQNKPQQNKISRQNAEQMLQALENDEKQTQEKVKKMQAIKAERSKVEKNW